MRHETTTCRRSTRAQLEEECTWRGGGPRRLACVTVRDVLRLNAGHALFRGDDLLTPNEGDRLRAFELLRR